MGIGVDNKGFTLHDRHLDDIYESGHCDAVEARQIIDELRRLNIGVNALGYERDLARRERDKAERELADLRVKLRDAREFMLGILNYDPEAGENTHRGITMDHKDVDEMKDILMRIEGSVIEKYISPPS